MSKQVTRTVKTFTIHGAIVKATNGKIETTPLAPLVIADETVNDTNAVKFLQKKFGKKEQYVVTKIDVQETTYAVPFDVFMANAKILEKAEAETLTQENS